jgi:hypothetical protein
MTHFDVVRITTSEYLPVSPMTLLCPVSGAKPGHDCKTPANVRLYVVHLARIKAAAKMDGDARKQKERSPTSLARGAIKVALKS